MNMQNPNAAETTETRSQRIEHDESGNSAETEPIRAPNPFKLDFFAPEQLELAI